MAQQGSTLYLERQKVRDQILRSYRLARVGLLAQTAGPTKLAARNDALQEAQKAQFVRPSRIGANHKEHVAILVADMRGSTQLAKDYEAEDIFILMQCLIPLLAFVASSCNGEVVGLRGDGVIAAFGFGESKWRDFVNRAYEAGMMMIEATRDILAPFLIGEEFVPPNAVGVSIDGGSVTMTKIGFGDAVEVTAYGDAVNQAAKSCKGSDSLFLSATMNRHLHDETSSNTFTPRRTRLSGK